MLLTGLRRHFEQQHREQSELPTEPDLSRPDAAFWLALEWLVDGDHDEATNVCLDLAAMPDIAVDLRVASGILASIALTAGRRYVRAVEVLEVLIEEVDQAHAHDVATAVARLHLGWRQSELGRWEEAIATTEEAVTSVADSDGRLERIVTSVGLENIANLRWRTGEHRFDDVVRMQELPPVAARLQPRGHLASALTRHVGETLEEQTTSPFSSQVRFRAEDRVEVDFEAARLQVECLASSSGIAQARRATAQTRLVRALDQAQEPAAGTFWLLLTSREHKLLKAVARWQAARGPLDALADEVNRTAMEPPPPLYEESALALLSAVGDLCATPQADDVVGRLLGLLEEEPEPSVRRTFSITLAAFDALAGTLPAASTETHDLVADRLADVVQQTSDPATLQSGVPRVLRALQWTELSTVTRQRWQRYAERDDTHVGDAVSVSTTVVFGLSRLLPEWAEHVALQAYRERRDSTWAAVLADVTEHVPAEVGREVVAEALERMGQERSDAAHGRHAMGGVRDALLVTVLVLRDEALPGWEDVCEYLADPAVDLENKELVANAAVRRRDRIDEQMLSRLRQAVEGGLRGRLLFSIDASQHEARGPWLRLAAAFDLRPTDQVIAELVALAHDPDPSERIEACWTIPHVAQDPAALHLLVHLTYDRHHAVRAAAAGAALRAVGDAPALREDRATGLLRQRVEALWTEPGRAVALALLQVADQLDPHALGNFRTELTRLASDHRSALVRRRARTPGLLGP